MLGHTCLCTDPSYELVSWREDKPQWNKTLWRHLPYNEKTGYLMFKKIQKYIVIIHNDGTSKQ